MPNIDLTKTEIPFLIGGNGSLRVHANITDLDQPLAPGDEDFFNLSFNAAGGHTLAIGAPGASGWSKSVIFAWTRSEPLPPIKKDLGLRQIYVGMIVTS